MGKSEQTSIPLANNPSGENYRATSVHVLGRPFHMKMWIFELIETWTNFRILSFWISFIVTSALEILFSRRSQIRNKKNSLLYFTCSTTIQCSVTMMYLFFAQVLALPVATTRRENQLKIINIHCWKRKRKVTLTNPAALMNL